MANHEDLSTLTQSVQPVAFAVREIKGSLQSLEHDLDEQIETKDTLEDLAGNLAALRDLADDALKAVQAVQDRDLLADLPRYPRSWRTRCGPSCLPCARQPSRS